MKSLLPGAERPVVQFENVGMRYGLGPEVLSDVSFRIAPRSFQRMTDCHVDRDVSWDMGHPLINPKH